ncbi:MAG: hypothetical protein II150_05090 [Thermoguttaceae bacterium]|nr:hypothetical protein [Thermoguttaceae bacterium]
MTALKNDFHRANVREAKYAKRTSSLRAVLCAVVVLSAALSGCDALRNHECCLFKPGGIFSQRNDEVERVRARDERDVIARATAVSNQKKEAWEPTESELSYARRNHVDLKNYVWAAQKPNGGVLFPQKLPAPGPIVLMEPSVISAPVGTEIILVASYVDSDSQHLRVGEQLSWDLTGVGNFVSTNPRTRLVNLNLPWRSNSREIEGRSETTETSGQLYRITRGTKSPEDDVTILRGQSWMAVTSLEEGTSSVSVFSSTVPNWDYRRASAEIHWIDAAFLFPKSAVGAVDRPGRLETAIVRRSDSQALPNWRVRYEILSGDGGFNDGRGGLARSIDVLTGADGKANVEIRQSAQRGGTSQIKVSILRPGTSEYKEVVVDSRTIYYTWTTSAPIGIQVVAPDFAPANQDVHYKIYINNFSEFYYDTSISIRIPQGASFVSLTPTNANLRPNAQSEIQTRISQLRPHEYYVLDLVLRKEHSGNIDLNVSLYDTRAVETPTARTGGAAPSGNVNPPVTNDPSVAPAIPY